MGAQQWHSSNLHPTCRHIRPLHGTKRYTSSTSNGSTAVAQQWRPLSALSMEQNVTLHLLIMEALMAAHWHLQQEAMLGK